MHHWLRHQRPTFITLVWIALVILGNTQLWLPPPLPLTPALGVWTKPSDAVENLIVEPNVLTLGKDGCDYKGIRTTDMSITHHYRRFFILSSRTYFSRMPDQGPLTIIHQAQAFTIERDQQRQKEILIFALSGPLAGQRFERDLACSQASRNRSPFCHYVFYSVCSIAG